MTPVGDASLDHRLYLHASWFEGDGGAAARRRAEAHIPEDLPFRTKPQIAASMVRDLTVLGIVGLDRVTADEEYGKNWDLLDELEELGQRHDGGPHETTVWTEDPASRVPPYSGAASRRGGRAATGVLGGRTGGGPARRRLAAAPGARGRSARWS